ncbi:CPBP family intramembrane glutamic endopeptidase [Aquibacillus rhizosphaerae]|uniref:CPBP family intramembrane metalloprotease n=1 Tax=Aquibacillus rhizosphaerae TaxID=3051431 RepID=A0ABT7L8U9_9BACI|nr:CPBP family intramembrane glutamic endopeptidase [Aquibacillus sp. LR5S19]MDL4842292.1 CPBP family intramembrane metalloprotease [Aquibacillus sp. LR5S19]
MFKNNVGQIRAGWFIAIAFIAMMIAQGVFMLPGFILFIVNEMANSSESLNSTADLMVSLNSQPWIALLAQGGGTAGGLLITILLWRYMNKMSLRELGFRGSLKDLSYGLFLGAASITSIFFVLLITGNVTLINTFSNPEFSMFTFSFLILFILVGFFEEVFFRGYIMSTMSNTGNKKWLIYIGSALLFSVVHGTNPNVSIFGLLNILLVGILFAYMFDVTNSLWMPIGYHITWNYFQGNVFGFAVSGTTPHGIYNVDVSEGHLLLTGGAFGLEGGLLATLLIVIGFIATYYYARIQKGSTQSQESVAS